MGNYLEKMLADHVMKADIELLKQMIQQDVNLIEWSFVKWTWLEGTCKLMKPVYASTLKNVQTNNIIEIVRKSRPDIIPHLDKDWLSRQVEYAKVRIDML